jgi:sugar/nucleoside kinase (ribokinase family)
MSECDVLILADYFCDLVITGLPEPPRLGADIFGDAMEIAPGGPYILAAGLHRLGIRALWQARLGNDLFSQFIAAEAQREGLDTTLFEHYDRPLRSLSVSFSFVQDRGFISYADIFPELRPEAALAAHHPGWVVNIPFNGSPRSRQLVDLVHQHGGRVYIDCQDTALTLAEPGLKDLLGAVDIFAPNRSEACQLTGEADPQKAAGCLAQFCPTVIVKCGPDGALACSKGRTWHSSALTVTVTDTTGAGDSFNAGFLAAAIRGEPFEVCLRYGNICGGLSTTRRGGASAAPTLAQLKQYLQE